MRHNQNRRSRGRSRKGPNPLTRSYESNGPDVKVRGTAAHVAEKYSSLARDALSSGDTVSAENYLQHAEHYNRIVMAAQAQFQQSQPQYREGGEDSYDEERQANGRARERIDYNGDGRSESGGEEQPETAEAGEDQGGRQARRANDQERPRGPRRRDAREPASREGEVEAAADPAAEPQPDVAVAEEAPKPRRRRRAPKAAEAVEGQDADSTSDGAAALAAFPE